MTSFVGSSSSIKNFIGNMLSCYSCVTVWAGLFITLLNLIFKNVGMVFNTFLSLSFLAVLMNKLENKFL